MAPFYDYAIPLFLVVCLILCIMAFLWVKQQRDNLQEPVKHKPVYSKPFIPEGAVKRKVPLTETKDELRELGEGFTRTKEGFVIADNSYQGSVPGGVSGSTDGRAVIASLRGSGSGSNQQSLWPTQFDLSPTLQVLYGRWETTPLDNYYDAYADAEIDSASRQLLRFNDIAPAVSPPPDFGSSLGAFDSETTRIPWDKDNESYKQTDVVWGYVSEQASRSIFLKTYVNQLAAAADSFIPCGEYEPAKYCYKSPLFDVTVSDVKLAYLVKTGEAVAQAVGTIPFNYLSVIDFNLGNFEAVREERRKSISRFLDAAKDAFSYKLGPVKTQTTKVGNALGLGVGARKVLSKFKAISDRIAAAFRKVLMDVQEIIKTSRNAISLTFTGGAIAANAAVPLTGGAATPVATFLSYVAAGIDLFFGVFGGIMMGVEAILIPMMDALLNTGGECPDDYKAISELLPMPVLTALSAAIPLAPFLQSFDPYVCWGKDSNGIANVRLRIPPKVPTFLSDRTLSLVYHAAWQTGSNPAIPSPTSLSFILDPLPPGFTWLEQSDLANKPNVNEITTFAVQAAKLAQGSRVNPVSGISAGSTLPSNIAVKACEPNTTPSSDGRQCTKKQMNVGVEAPSLSACSAGTADDGYNCWKVVVDPNCTGGKISYTTTQTWNDATGYFRVTTEPLVCGGVTQPEGKNSNIVKNYNERIQCTNPAFPDRLPTETLCFAKCPAGFLREGSICKGTTESHDREYMYGTSTLYKQQKFDAKLLNNLSDVTIPYCDFSKPYMLNRMAQFYYKNSLQNPLINEDGTIQIQMITKFFGVIASSELSCDVVCAIDYITYDPITGGNYSSYTGCSYPEDEVYKACSFCYRRFYFIRTGNEPNRDEFTVTGCTWADYTAPEAMVQSRDIGTNLVASLPKKFDILRKDGTIVNVARFNDEWQSGRIMARAGAGLMDAGISIAAGMFGGWAGGNVGARAGAVGLTGQGGVNAGIREGAKAAAKAATKAAMREGAELAEKEAAEAVAKESAEAVTAIAKALQRSAGEAAEEAVERATAVAVASGMSEQLAATIVADLNKRVAAAAASEARGALIGGLVAGTGAGLFSSLYLAPVLANTAAGAIKPEDVDGAANTYVTGKDMYNLQVATNNNWWTINHGPIYELAEGVVPTLNFCEGVKILSSHCTHKYVVRDMVNKYHNENERRHIKEILSIEPRGTDGCYYKWNEVEFDPATNIEQTVLLEKEIILSHVIADYATCTFKPTQFTTNINDPAYAVRSYVDPSTAAMPVPRIIYPTRNVIYTSDLFARYVRVRPPLPGTTSGDRLINLAQLSVFDVSGFNISTQLNTFGTSVAPGAATADIAVNGTSTQSEDLSTVWQPATNNAATEYWEVDLEKLVNISEVIYFGATFEAAKLRNKGVRIEFLYTNGPRDAPIFTFTLPSDNPIQLVPLYSSSSMAPTYPIAGPIKIPRPILPGMVLGTEFGCANRCEDRGVIDSMIQQYNEKSTNATIMKVLRAVTANSTTCEYEAEVVKTDVAGGSTTIAKNSITKQFLSMQVAPTVVKGFGNVLARYVKITPSYTPGTVLEFSRIIVRNTVRGGPSSNYSDSQHYVVSTGKDITAFNTFFELKEIYCDKPSPTSPVCRFNASKMNFLLAPPVNYTYDHTKIDAEMYPKVWRAADNQEGTFFCIDLLPPGAGSPSGGNYEIFDIAFIGCSDRTRGGIHGVKIELFADRPQDPTRAFTDGVAIPTFTYYLPTDDVKQLIKVEKPSKCEFMLTKTDLLASPTFLQNTTAPLSAVDTSGGVFSFSSMIDTVKSAWNTLMPLSSTDMVGPIQTNLKQSNQLVRQMLTTIEANKTLLNSSKKCSDPDILKLMMSAYNIKKAAPITVDSSVTRNIMSRILKAGQSTPSTCDILFEDIEEEYDDYISDVKDNDGRTKSIKTARFTFKPSTAASQVVPDSTSIVYDISANALGLMSDSSALSPVYSGPTCAVDCGNPLQIKVIASKLATELNKAPAVSSLTETTRVSFVSANETFQSTPLSCEYRLSKVISLESKITGTTVVSSPVDTYAKAIFTLGTDGCTPLLSSVEEYNPSPEVLTFYKDPFKTTLKKIRNNKEVEVEVTLPSLFWYNPSKEISTRVDSTVKNI